MGSFNATCIVSNLPVEYGTAVRYVLLTRSRFHPDGNDHICYVGGRWQLRGAPIKAKYNDYGSIESIEESFTTTAMFDTLRRDAVEKGVGDNQCHDVQVRPDMPQKDWLEALWEGRVFVLDDPWRPGRGPLDWTPPEPEKGFPSLSRIEAVLRAAGLAVTTGDGAEGFIVDEVSRGFIRVRAGGYGIGKEEQLRAVLAPIDAAGYAAMITCGTGSSSNRAEILVAPKPAPDGVHFFATGLQEKKSDLLEPKPRPVSQAMIREDVWQVLLGTTIEGWRGTYTFEMMKTAALRAVDEAQERAAKIAEIKATGDKEKLAALSWMIFEATSDRRPGENLFHDSIRESEGTSGYSLKQAFEYGLEAAKTDAELRAYVTMLAETAYVQWVYSTLHGQWHPTTNSGQDGNWKTHRTFLSQILVLTIQESRKREVETVDDEEPGKAPPKKVKKPAKKAKKPSAKKPKKTSSAKKRSKP